MDGEWGRLARALDDPPEAFDGPPPIEAAVAVVLRGPARDPEALFIERARRAEDPWSGHVAFPGGRRAADDATPSATASRETREEIGVDLAAAARPLGALPVRSPRNRPSLPVVPLVYVARGPWTPVPGPEVRDAFWMALRALPPLRAVRDIVTHVGTYRMPCFVLGERLLWGFTYRVLEDLFPRVGVPWSED
jgi:8-oxo-dGTP pyrophosphatase MutT (NUDIX family)